MKTIILFTFLLSGFCGCKKNNSNNPVSEVFRPIREEEYIPIQIPCYLSRNLDTAKLYIQGTWEWLEEKRMTRNHGLIYLTPQTQGYTLTLKLKNDTAWFFKNNQPGSVYTYKILQEKEITNYPDDNKPVIAYYRLSDNLRSSYVPIKICPEYLLMQHQYVSSIVGENIWKKQ